MSDSKPQYLYKYMPDCFERIGEIVANRRIFFSSPSKFNDPFDSALGIQFPDSGNIANKDLDRQIETDHIIKKTAKVLGVFCVSATMESVAMWAHYAANHSGVVIEFDYASLVDLHLNIRHFKVDYETSFPSWDDFNEAHESKDNLYKFAKLFFCRKSIEWEREEEWRFFTTPADTYLDLPDSAITRIIFGMKMSESNKQLIQKWAQGGIGNIVFSDAIKSKVEFKIIARDRISTGDHNSPDTP